MKYNEVVAFGDARFQQAKSEKRSYPIWINPKNTRDLISFYEVFAKEKYKKYLLRFVNNGYIDVASLIEKLNQTGATNVWSCEKICSYIDKSIKKLLTK